MYCCHPIAPPNQDPPDDLSTNRPQQAAICSTEQANKNKQTKKTKQKQTLKPYDQRRISANHTPPSLRFPPAFQFPADFKDDCVLTQNPARFYPTETVTSQMSLSLGLDLRPGHWREAAAQSSKLPAPRGWRVPLRCSAAHPGSALFRAQNSWQPDRTNQLEALQLAS